MTDDKTLAPFNALFPTDHADKNRRSRLQQFAAWLNTNGKGWHDARLDEYRDYLLYTRQLAPLSVRNHLATIRQRYRDLMEDNEVIETLETMAFLQCEAQGYETNPANVQAVVNRWIRMITNNTSPRKAQVKVDRVQEHEDDKFIRLPPAVIDERLAAIPLDTPHGRRDAAICALLYACGLREQECADVDVSDLRQRYQEQPALRVKRGKGRKKRMVVYGDMWRYLEQYVLTWMQSQEITGGRVLRSFAPGTVNMTDSVSVDTIQRAVNRWMLVKPHDLRRSYAKNMRDAGMSLDALRQQLGHEHQQTTQGYIGDLDASDRTPRTNR